MIQQHAGPRSNQAGGSSFRSTAPRHTLPPAWPRTVVASPAAGPRDPVMLCCKVSRDDNLPKAERQLCVNMGQTTSAGETNWSLLKAWGLTASCRCVFRQVPRGANCSSSIPVSWYAGFLKHSLLLMTAQYHMSDYCCSSNMTTFGTYFATLKCSTTAWRRTENVPFDIRLDMRALLRSERAL